MPEYKVLVLTVLNEILRAAHDDEEILAALEHAAENRRAAVREADDRKREKMEEDIRRAQNSGRIAAIEDYCRSRGRGTSRDDALGVFRGGLPADVDLDLIPDLLEDASPSEAADVLRVLANQVLGAYRATTAELEAKARDAIREYIAVGIELAGSDADDARKAFKKALKLIREMEDRQAEAASQIHD